MVIDQKRLVAIVSSEMAKIVRGISEQIHNFEGLYQRAPASLHLQNFPQEFEVKRSSLISIKSAEAKGNFQLTIGIAKDGRISTLPKISRHFEPRNTRKNQTLLSSDQIEFIGRVQYDLASITPK